MNAEAIIKCEIVVPISSQLPLSLTKKKKLSVIMSVVDMTRRKRLKGGNARQRLMTPKMALKRKNGIMILKIMMAPMRKGSKMVVKRYTEEILKLEMDAMFPVPKNETLMKRRKNAAVLKSEDVNFLDSMIPSDVETDLLYGKGMGDVKEEYKDKNSMCLPSLLNAEEQSAHQCGVDAPTTAITLKAPRSNSKTEPHTTRSRVQKPVQMTNK